MSATTTVNFGASAGQPQHGVTFLGLLNSEWIKLRTLRSTFWCFGIIVVMTIGLGLFIASFIVNGSDSMTKADASIFWSILLLPGVSIGQLVVAVLGTLMITGEYGTGMIRSTVTAVPKRLPVLFAKTIVFGVTTFVVSFFSIIVLNFAALPMLSAKSIYPNLADARAWLTFVGAAGFLALIGMLALAFGTIVRHTAAGIATSLGLLLVVPILVSGLSFYTGARWISNVGEFLPSNVGAKIYSYQHDSTAVVSNGLVQLDATQSLLVLIGWLVVALAIASLVLKRRDV